MAQVLTGQRLRVGRGRRVLLEDFDIAVEAGDVLRVAGPNGSGKSSLLRVLAGVVMPRGGRLERLGRCAYVPERVLLPAGMRGRRWLELMARMRHGAPAELETELDQRCGVLSKGQLQRVTLADALDSGSSILVLDEPWTGLDAAASAGLGRRLTALAQAGVAVLFTDRAATATVLPTRTLLLGAAVERRSNDSGAARRLARLDDDRCDHDRPADQRRGAGLLADREPDPDRSQHDLEGQMGRGEQEDRAAPQPARLQQRGHTADQGRLRGGDGRRRTVLALAGVTSMLGALGDGDLAGDALACLMALAVALVITRHRGGCVDGARNLPVAGVPAAWCSRRLRRRARSAPPTGD